MKFKITLGIAIIALAALLVPNAFAAIDNQGENTSQNDNQQFINQMFDQHKAWLDQAVKGGKVTEDQATTWNEHFEQMKEFHSKNGISPMMNGGMMNMMGNGSGLCPGFGNNGTQ
ncbi:hypothetical protein [Desulforamulus aquiferis]|uniref:DUF2680 domain-containing protein n=1 Tax=Desulforamulus aquiferis TaxID=1397668 RepID=A0AAW7ZDM7_9FIRM|nr:hypothetical protein [Desulforamulus aquiferis]MDO7787375.1 hypothetical protein [Desulforamulus aquiferis]RYD02374.1 hypothetical protein N752_23880 [Desulforamulus aquiferis]